MRILFSWNDRTEFYRGEAVSALASTSATLALDVILVRRTCGAVGIENERGYLGDRDAQQATWRLAGCFPCIYFILYIYLDSRASVRVRR